MSVITVPMLCALKEGVAGSDNTLQGILRVLDRDQQKYNRGTLLLIDPITQQSIPCRIDRFNPQTDRKRVEIKLWNYIYNENEGYQYLEFSLDDVYTKKAELSALRNGIVQDLDVIQTALETKTPFYTPSFSTKQIPKSNINVTGVVVAISPLYRPIRSEARFFVELADANEEAAITLYFSGDKQIKYQLCFRIGQYYTFTDLSPTTVSYGRNTRDVLLFQPSSTMQIITVPIYQQLEIVKSYPLDGDNHKLTISKVPKEISTYTGYITRVIDAVLGVYELDDTIVLSVFHHFVSAQPFRVNTKIRITHFHKAYIYTDNSSYYSILLNDMWKMNKRDMDNRYHETFVACNKTRIEIISFPNSCHVDSSNFRVLNDTREAIVMYMILRHSTFSQFIRILEIYATLIIRFKLDSLTTDQFQGIIENISNYIFKATNTPSNRRPGSLGNDFFQHAVVCSAIGSKCTVDDRGYLSVYLDVYPYISECVDYLDKRLTNFDIDLPGANFAFDVSAINVRSSNFDPTKGFFILGVINQTTDGRLILKDHKSSIPLSIESLESIQLGDMYILRCGRYFYEDLSYRKETSTFDLSTTYLSCHSNNLLKVFSKSEDGPILQFQSQHSFDFDKLGLFNIGSNPELLSVNGSSHQYIVCHVLKKFPISTSLDKTGKLMMECRLVVRLYNIGVANNEDFIEMDPNKIYDLILNTRLKSLGLSYQLNVDDWCVIYGLDQTGTKLKTRELDNFTLDVSHKIYPIIFSEEPIHNAVSLIPVLSNHDPLVIQPPRPIIKISQINDPDRPRIMGNNSEYINVRGVVILKKFEQRRGVGVYDSLAQKSFKKYGLGTAVPHRNVQIQLRELDSLQMITINMDLTNVHYPLGLIHGATVVFRTLMRKIKNNDTVYYNAGSETLIQVESTIITGQVHRIQTNEAETKSINWISQMQQEDINIQDKLLRIHCNISTVMSIQLKWKCSQCGFSIKNSECYAMCQNASRIFNASSFIEISDGTSSANANVDGERLVFRLLRLSDSQITALKDFVSLEEIDYSVWNPTSHDDLDSDKMKKMCGLTVDDLITRARAVPNFWMYGKVQTSFKRKKPSDFQQNDGKPSMIRPITISDNGGLLRTHEFIKTKLSIQEIEVCDPVSYSYSWFNKI